MDGGWVPTLVVRAASWLGDWLAAAVFEFIAQSDADNCVLTNPTAFRKTLTTPGSAMAAVFRSDLPDHRGSAKRHRGLICLTVDRRLDKVHIARRRYQMQDCVLTLDIGSSSARALLFGLDGQEIPGFEARISYQASTTESGGWEIDAAKLIEVAVQTVDQIYLQMQAKAVRPAAVAVDTFWHSIVGVSADGKTVTPVLHPFDSRAADAAKELALRIDNDRQHSRTGCVLHPSYPPAKLLWLFESQPEAFRAAQRWMSFGEYLFMELFGIAACSTSMISASGLWNQNANVYDREILEALPVKPAQFAPVDAMDEEQTKLSHGFATRWSELDGIPWFPALGDGACDNVGSGCTKRDSYALMVGTSGAMRACERADSIEIPSGLFCYRLDRNRFVLGGALSNGGEVFTWMRNTLQLPQANELERQLAELQPSMHGLTILPLFAGERSTGWRADATAAITGLVASTTPIQILHAGLESVVLRFRNVYDLITASLGVPQEVIASGGGLLHSPSWTKMMADGLPHSVTPCLEPEATSRGAALMALERIGAIRDIGDLVPKLGMAVPPDKSKQSFYDTSLQQQRRLYNILFRA
jgi:gluconokinase